MSTTITAVLATSNVIAPGLATKVTSFGKTFIGTCAKLAEATLSTFSWELKAKRNNAVTEGKK
ncbi:MAG TPA: hypothetical protein VD884_20820 [Ohtaekwangia sp.]|nr:hypothetical protein [Ohtaekwangia sp.]